METIEFWWKAERNAVASRSIKIHAMSFELHEKRLLNTSNLRVKNVILIIKKKPIKYVFKVSLVF